MRAVSTASSSRPRLRDGMCAVTPATSTKRLTTLGSSCGPPSSCATSQPRKAAGSATLSVASCMPAAHPTLAPIA
eukprot:scaffold84111_cov60-Phaeocystis_antarctica.AAC.2